jgi:branched-chain amino acid transport system ATP-binding protein
MGSMFRRGETERRESCGREQASVGEFAPPALAIDGLGVTYGRVGAVAGVSLSIPVGGSVAVLGPNGAGKTSLCRALVGAVRPSAGTITLNGRRLGDMTPDRRVRLGLALVPEGRGLLGSLTVRDNLLLGAYCQPHDEKDTLEATLGGFPVLRELLSRPARALSGGELQMLAIARALMSKPAVLVLDEPSMGLAPKTVEAVIENLARVRASGTTMLIAEQNAWVGLRLADEVIVMEGGEVVARGTPDSIAKRDDLLRHYLSGLVEATT